jgi:Protein of unknown function (DUF1579)
MPSPNAGQPDPRFDTITGRWRTLGHVVAEPPIPVRGTDTYELLAGGHFLVHHVDVTVGDEPLQAIEIIGEHDGETYLARSFDSNGTAELMHLTIDDQGAFHFSGGGDVASTARPTDAQTTRVRSTLTVAADRQTMSAHWERSDDGVTCQDWMNITFTR